MIFRLKFSKKRLKGTGLTVENFSLIILAVKHNNHSLIYNSIIKNYQAGFHSEKDNVRLNTRQEKLSRYTNLTSDREELAVYQRLQGI